jgi:hypothetical protein
MNFRTVKISEVKTNPNNPRLIKDDKFHKLVKSIQEFPKMLEIRPIVVNSDMIVLGGNMRLKACKEAGLKEIPVIFADDLTEDQQREFIIKDNVGFGEWDWEMIANEWDSEQLQEWGLDIPDFDTKPILDENKEKEKKLSDRFIIPPFSVLDTRQSIWQDRKRYWLSLGIESELGRDSKSVKFSKMAEDLAWAGQKTGISIFDPVLCELSYHWFNVPNGKILDPFAGGSVRGIVASKLGFQYLGNDLRIEQIEANRINAIQVLKDSKIYPTWTHGDSLKIDTIAKNYKADFLFSCPPYSDLEVYSDLAEDLSNMPYQKFLTIYTEIISKSCKMLNDDRFAVFVVGDIRDKNGFYHNFVSDTIKAFLDSGLFLYNEMILVNAIGAKAIGANGYMKSRKIGKVHQNVLVFYKGDPKKIKENYPELDLSYIQDEKIDE